MGTRYDSPQIAALKLEVEKAFGRPVKTPADFVLVADRIESKTREHISDSTIKRLFNPVLAYNTISSRTLNVISQYAGYDHFEAFCKHLAESGQIESEAIDATESIKTEDLTPGDLLRITWMPNRELTLKYLGKNQFQVVSSINSSVKTGDTFFCSSFTKGRCLYVDNLLSDGKVSESYAMGTSHGLTSVTQIK